MDELSFRCAKFTVNALDRDSDVVSYIASLTWHLLRSDVVADWPKCIFLLLEIWCFDISHCTAKDIVRGYVRRAQSLDVILCTVYLSCFMSGTDTLLSAFLRVMSLCICYLSFVNWLDVYCFFLFFSCTWVRFSKK